MKISNAEKGRLFQGKCQQALELALGRKLEREVSIGTPSGASYRCDLATPERDAVAECKCYDWTVGGNVPSAKIVHLREALQRLRLLPEGVTRYLIIRKSPHPVRPESLGAYFVRLNRHELGSVSVLELPEEGGGFTVLHGAPPEDRRI
jgi:hypothetical protein